MEANTIAALAVVALFSAPLWLGFLIAYLVGDLKSESPRSCACRSSRPRRYAWERAARYEASVRDEGGR